MKMNNIPAGKRIVLRLFTEKHLNSKEYISWLRDYDVVKFINRKEYLMPIDFEQVKSYVEGIFKSNTNYLFAIELKEGNKFIGTFKFGRLDWVTRTVDLGILIGDKDYWGKGIAKEVYELAIDFCFTKLGLRKVVAGCTEPNIGMRKVLKKLGFIQEGCLREQDFIEGKYVHHYVFGLLKEEYKKTGDYTSK